MAERLDLPYQQDPTTGIYVPDVPVHHRAEQYDPAGFRMLLDMQDRHFWYRGRHRFLLHTVKRELRKLDSCKQERRAVDLGGGCGGWLRYLDQSLPGRFHELALADSSLECLAMARGVVGDHVRRYLADLRHLHWRNHWDMAFLLDVLEHLPDPIDVLRQVHQAMRPGGRLFVTTPALEIFWSSNDELVHHVRRYSRQAYAELAQEVGFELSVSRYFMFFLSPFLWMRRRRKIDVAALSDIQRQAKIEKEHQVPSPWINRTLAAVFAMETPLGSWVPFPWGTSVLGVFRKP